MNYPDQKVPVFPKYRGKQVLMRDENGLEKCVACGLCAVACPADAIYLEAAENDGTVMAGPRYAKIYQIHKTRCIFCGYCEEACPVSAIFMGKDYELAVYSNEDFIWDKQDLLVPASTSTQTASRGPLARSGRDPGAARRAPTPFRMKPFLDALDERVLVCDGAMGTMLYAQGIFLNRCFDELNLSQPDLVGDVHQAYVRAGADILETNTFGANRVKLATFGLADSLHAINVQGARLARQAARDRAYVAGAIGPLGMRIEPWGKTGHDEAEGYFREQAQALADGGVDLFMLETFRDLNEMAAAMRAVRSVCALPIVAQMTIGEDGNTLDGTPPEQFAPVLASPAPTSRHQLQHRPGADARDARAHGRAHHGATVGAAQRRPAARRRRPHALPLVARVHGVVRAPLPRRRRPPRRRLLRHDARAHPAHQALPRGRLRRGRRARRARGAPGRRPQRSPPSTRWRVPDKSFLANALARGRCVTLVELPPPRGYAQRGDRRAGAAAEDSRRRRRVIPDERAAVRA